jgi:hypothetical protein
MPTIHDMLSHDERIVILSDEAENVLVTWNQSLTLQSWDSETFQEIDLCTLSTEPVDFYEARQKVIAWHLGAT